MELQIPFFISKIEGGYHYVSYIVLIKKYNWQIFNVLSYFGDRYAISFEISSVR